VLPAFRRGLNKQGYVEGRNVTIEYRWSDTQDDRLPTLAADLVRRQVAVLVTAGSGASVVRVFQGINPAIPTVSTFTSPDIAFKRPAGNVTGVYSIFNDLGEKRIGLMHDLLPRATTMAACQKSSKADSMNGTVESSKERSARRQLARCGARLNRIMH
jgi:putative ABC transport system substrate-binding protein